MAGRLEESRHAAIRHRILEARGLSPPEWLPTVHHLETACRRALGTARHIQQRAAAAAQRAFHGIRWCRRIFTDERP